MTIQQAAATTYAFHTDPGHGWLFVPGQALRAVGLGPVHFSRYSYLDGATGTDGMYLEEDIDAGIFLARLRALAGAEPKIEDICHHGDAFIRDQKHNRAGWAGFESVTNWPEVQGGAVPEFKPAMSQAEIWAAQDRTASFVPGGGCSHDD